MPPTCSQKILKALTAPAVYVSPLMTVFFVQTTHLVFNSLLLSPWNPLRCSFWGQLSSCTESDVGWMLNWFAYSKFHLAVLLGFLGFSAIGPYRSAYIESKLGCLSFSISLCYLVEGIISLKYFNAPMAIFQATVLVILTLATLFWVSTEELRPGSVYLDSAFQSRSISQSQQRHKVAIPTIALSMQAVLSSLRVIGMAFGSNIYGGYLGDGSSDLFENIASLTKCDAMLVPIVMIFSLFFCNIDHHRCLLYGQAVSLFVSLIILCSKQGEKIEDDYVKASMVGTFSSIVLSVAGSM